MVKIFYISHDLMQANRPLGWNGWRKHAPVCPRPPAPPRSRRRRRRRRSGFGARRPGFPHRGRSTGSPSTRGCACGWTGAPSTWARPSPSQRCPAHAVGRRRAILIDGREGPSARASTTGPDREARGRGRVHRPRLRRLHGSVERRDVRLGELALSGDRGLHRRPQPRLLAAEPDLLLGARTGRRRLAPDPHLRRIAVADQQLQLLREAEPRLRGRSGRGGGERRGRRRAGDRHRPRQPDLFRHGELRAHLQRDRSTLTFLAAWTDALHAAGYESGVYSSSASGIADLASKWGTPYSVPDDLWIANWNGAKTTDDPYVPDTAWTPHRRIHQYRGGARRDLRRGDDQHRQQLRRRGYGRLAATTPTVPRRGVGSSQRARRCRAR